MKKKIFPILWALAFAGAPFGHAAADETPALYNDFPTIGVSAGYSRITGYYNAFFSNGNSFGINISYPLNMLNLRVLADGDLIYQRWVMDQNKDFGLTCYTFRAGPLVYYPLFEHAYPFIAAYFQESSVYLGSGMSSRSEQSYKPGYALKGGIISPLYGGFGLKLGAEYSSMSISGRIFGQVVITGALVFNYKGYSGRERSDTRDSGDLVKKTEALMAQGRKYFVGNDIMEAKKYFLMAVNLEKGNGEAESFLARIAVFENRLKAADRLMAGRKFYEAIPILVELKPYMKKAGESLLYARWALAAEIPGLEKEGISAYEKQDYDHCIVNMEKLLLIDPDNNTANIYLPRSRKRKEAMDKLR